MDTKTREKKRKVFKCDAITDWLDYASGLLDMYEVVKNEFLAEYKLPPKNTSFYRNVILPFTENTLIMDNIAHSEQVSYDGKGEKNKLKIKVFHNGIELTATYPHLQDMDENGGIKYPKNFPYLLRVGKDANGNREEDKEAGTTVRDAINDKKIEGGEDIEICLASEHSIYSILENFIRNSAKHNKDKLSPPKKEDIENGTEENEAKKEPQKDLEIILKVTDSDHADYYDLLLYDNVSEVTAETLLKLEAGIEADLFESDGQLVRTSLGIADMKINAYLLQTADEIDNEKLKTAMELVYCDDCNDPISGQYVKDDKDTLQQLKEENSTKKHRFAYKFKLSKPKKLLWIGKKDVTNAEEWNKKGIIFKETVEEISNNNQEDKPLAAYSFAILEPDAIKGLNEDEFEDLLLKLPFRVLINSSADQLKVAAQDEKNKALAITFEFYKDRRIQTIETPLKFGDTDDFSLLKSCWENWLKRWLTKDERGIGYEKVHLGIYLENDKAVESWGIDSKKITLPDFIKVSIVSGENAKKPLIKHNYEEVNPKPSIEEDAFFILYDRHANGYNSFKPKKKDFKFVHHGQYFQFDKSSEDFVNLFYPPVEDKNKTLRLLEAIEAGIMKIVVLDERIAAKLSYSDRNIKTIIDSNGFNVSNEDEATSTALMNQGGTFVISNFMNETILSPLKNFELSIEKQEIILKQPSHVTQNNFDGLIIHRTYLNKLLDEMANVQQPKSSPELNAINLLKALNKRFKRIVITSGGGYPHSLPDKVKVHFQPFSLLHRNFIKYQSKISLTKLL